MSAGETGVCGREKMSGKVVILARGLGTRMQRQVKGLDFNERTRKMVDEGTKAMIPIRGRPFLDYSIQDIIRAGFTEVCLVVGPHNNRIRDYYGRIADQLPTLEISFAEQKEPLGTADAVLAARKFVGRDSFVMINSDNLYSESSLRMLRIQKTGICYSVGFDKDGLIRKSNIEETRISRFAVMQVDANWNLVRLVEKPSDPWRYRVDDKVLVNMNLFKFTPHIFRACERIEPHPVRKEYEITSAVQYLVDNHIVPVKVLYSNEGVLDLTYRTDIPAVRAALEARNLEF